jgi:DNA recombination protein Rad52
MTLSAKQIQALKRNVNSRHIRRREVNGRELCYVEGWFVISEANRIFGFDGWNRETVESRCVLSRESRGNFLVVYIANVRISVHAAGATIVREGHGTGEGRSTSPGEAHELALKVAETDATKRALATFGKPFGLALYANVKLPPADNQTSKHSTVVQATRERSPRDVIQVHRSNENRQQSTSAATSQHTTNSGNQSDTGSRITG